MRSLLGFSEPVWVGHLEEEFPNEPPPAFSSLYELQSFAVWALDQRVYELQENWEFGRETQPRTCAFCDRTTANGAQFKMVSHVVPESLGNKRIISHEECDDCNNKYSACEGDLARMLSVERVFSGARGKAGPASFDPDEDLSIKGRGIGEPIELWIDSANSPIRDVGGNELEIPISRLEFKPLMAIRSILRSAWLILPQRHRPRLQILKDTATGNKVELPLEYISFFSPGVPLAAGRIRVWTLNESSKDGRWPAVVVALSFFNTTIVWRSPLNGAYVLGPTPPIPSYDEKETPHVTRMSILVGEKVTNSHTLSLRYSHKKEFASEASANDETQIARADPTSQVRASREVKIAVARDEGAVQHWIDARYQIKKISHDLSRVSQAAVLAPSHGLRLWLKTASDKRQTLSFDYNADGLAPQMALVGLDFCEKLAGARDDDQLIIKHNDHSAMISLASREASGFSGEDYKRARENITAFAELGRKLNVDLKLPTPASSVAMAPLSLAIKAIVHGVSVRVRESQTIEFSISKKHFEELATIAGTCNLKVAEGVYPFAGIEALTADRVGPISIYVELTNAAKEPDAAVVRSDEQSVELHLKVESLVFVFEKFLRR